MAAVSAVSPSPEYAVPYVTRPRAYTDPDVVMGTPERLRPRDDETGIVIVPLSLSEHAAHGGSKQQATPGYSSGYLTGSSTPPVRSKFATRRAAKLPLPPPFRHSPSHSNSSAERDVTWPQDSSQSITPYASVHLEAPLSKPTSRYSSTPAPCSDSAAAYHYPATGQMRVDGAQGPAGQQRISPPHQSTPSRREPPSKQGLLSLMKRMKELDLTVRKQLARADKHLMKGELGKAIPFLEAGLLQTDGFPHLQSLLWMLLGSAHARLGQYKKASVCHLHHLAYCRELNNFRGLTKAECNLGIAYMKLGLYRLAGRCFLQYLENCRVLRDDLGISVACSNLGLLSRTLATEGYKASLKEGDPVQAQEVLNSNLHRAIAYFEQHLEIVEQFGDLEKQGRAYGNLGNCYEILRQYTQAIFCHNKRLEIVRSTGDRTSECCALCNLGNCFRATGKLQEAMQYYQLNLDMTQSIEDGAGEVVTLLNLGATCELVNKLDEAVEWYTLYLSKMVERGDVKGQAKGFSILAGLYEDTGQTVKAHEYYKKLVEVFQQLGDVDAHTAALQYLRETKAAIKSEKLQNRKKTGTWRRKRSKSAGKSRTISRSTGIAMQPPPPPPQRVHSSVGKMATWSPSQRVQFQLNVRPSMATSESFSSALVFENPATAHLQEHYRYRAEVAAQRSEVGYQSQWMSERLREEEEETMTTATPMSLRAGSSNPTHLIHSMYQYPPDSSEQTPHSHSPSNMYTSSESFTELRRLNTDSEADYESIREGATLHFRGHDISSSTSTYISSSGVPGDHRHFEELKKLSDDFTSGSRTLTPLGLEEGTDKEWEQWLLLQDEDALSNVGSLNIDMSAFTGRRSSSPSMAGHRIRQAISAPHVDLPEQESTCPETMVTHL